MIRFVKWFYEFEVCGLVNKINKYAEDNNLTIISLATNTDQHGAIVLFEGNKPRW
jgi:hypothetical protein